MAVKVTDFRLQKQTQQLNLFNNSSYKVELHKYDYDTLRKLEINELELDAKGGREEVRVQSVDAALKFLVDVAE